MTTSIRFATQLMKKIILSTLLFSTTIITSSAFAMSEDSVHIPSAPYLSTVYTVTENKEEVPVTRNTITKAKYRAEKLISERIKSLNSNASAITDSKNLTNEQKATLSTYITGNITQLTELKSSIGSSTDATSTKLLIDSIFKDFRIYGIVIPKVRLDSRIYQLKKHADTLSLSFSKVQTKIDESKLRGKDITSWQKGLDEAKMLVAQDMFKLDELLKKTTSLTPANYGTTSKAVIDEVNREIKVISRDFNTVVNKVRKPYNLKNIQVQASASSTSTTPR